MAVVTAPAISRVDPKTDDRYGKFVVEPLERGYGITIGNALRRVLLSSMTGSAVIAARFHGVPHEFTAIPHVVEDVVDIVLNLKQLAIRSETRGLLRIEAEGPCVVTAGDLKGDPALEIMNPDLVIARIDAGGRLEAELTVGTGRGYVQASDHPSQEWPIGTIAIDAIFSPIQRVNFSVEDTRVGNQTDFDRLTLELWTNGTLTPEEAIAGAARILMDRFAPFAALDGTPLTSDLAADSPAQESAASLLTIEELDLSARAYNCLKGSGITTVAELIMRSEGDLMLIRNMGKKSIQEVKDKLAALGLSLSATSITQQ